MDFTKSRAATAVLQLRSHWLYPGDKGKVDAQWFHSEYMLKTAQDLLTSSGRWVRGVKENCKVVDLSNCKNDVPQGRYRFFFFFLNKGDWAAPSLVPACCCPALGTPTSGGPWSLLRKLCGGMLLPSHVVYYFILYYAIGRDHTILPETMGPCRAAPFPRPWKRSCNLTKKYSTLLFYCITNQLWSSSGQWQCY